MKIKLLTTLILFCSLIINAQNFTGKAIYKTSIKSSFSFDEDENSTMSDDMKKQLQAQLHKMNQKTFILNFDQKTSSYIEETTLDVPKPQVGGGDIVMMFGSSGNNIKRLYGIAPNSISLGGSYSNNDIDWLLRYNTTAGTVSISTATQDGQIGCETKRSTWTNGWSGFLGYRTNGEPHLFLQKEVGGTTKIHPLDWDGTLESETKDSSWSDGWSNFHSWEHAGSTHLFHYKSGASYTGLMRVSELTSGGDTSCCTEDEYWSTGWMTHVYTLPNGDDYLLRHHPVTNAVRIAPLGAGTIGSDIFNSTWTTEYTRFSSVQSGSSTFVVALNVYGTITIFEADSNGLLQTLNSNTTVINDWSELQTYNLEGDAIVHAYRASDGFFTLYHLDSAGQLSSPIDSWFDELGWSGWTHFTTSH